jgi:hypothetical protein
MIIKLSLKKKGGVVDWIDLAQDGESGGLFVNNAKCLQKTGVYLMNYPHINCVFLFNSVTLTVMNAEQNR